MAIKFVMKDARPTLTLSGINAGGNLGEDITYSGTVAAAMESTLLGVPAVALSQHYARNARPKWETGETYPVEGLRRPTAAPWPPHTPVNANFPAVPPPPGTGIAGHAQGRRKLGNKFRQH